MSRPDKRLISLSERTDLAGRWPPDTPDLAAERAERERVGLAEAHPSIVLPASSGPPGCRELARVGCAWLVLALCGLYLLAQLARWAWVVIFG